MQKHEIIKLFCKLLKISGVAPCFSVVCPVTNILACNRINIAIDFKWGGGGGGGGDGGGVLLYQAVFISPVIETKDESHIQLSPTLGLMHEDGIQVDQSRSLPAVHPPPVQAHLVYRTDMKLLSMHSVTKLCALCYSTTAVYGVVVGHTYFACLLSCISF